KRSPPTAGCNTPRCYSCYSCYSTGSAYREQRRASALSRYFRGRSPFFTLILENIAFFCLTSLKADFVPSPPFFNLLCPCRGGQVLTQGQHADLLDRSATLRLPTAKPLALKGIKPGFRA